MTYLLSNQIGRSQTVLGKIGFDRSKQPVALIALGALRYQKQEDAGSYRSPDKSGAVGRYLLEGRMVSSLFVPAPKEIRESRDHAELAIKVGKENARLAAIVLGEGAGGLGEREEAASTFDKFAKENPQNPNTKDALRWARLMLRHPSPAKPKPSIKLLETFPAGSEELAMSLPLTPPIEIPPRADWAPSDIDAAKPFVVAGATCPLARDPPDR